MDGMEDVDHLASGLSCWYDDRWSIAFDRIDVGTHQFDPYDDPDGDLG